MVTVDKVSDTVFQVVITGIDFRTLTKMMLRTNTPSDDIVRGILCISLGVVTEDNLLGRNRNELEGKNGRMGRR